MPKTTTPDSVKLPHDTFEANARPDPFDARDLTYLPRLQVLPKFMDRRANDSRYVYHQTGQSCTGHALAAVINHVLEATTAPKRVSPYMLYQFARRYDEFPGEADAGSSLRAAFKGWFNHGVALERTWPKLDSPPIDPADERAARDWRDRPLGAFYRVNPFRLDDVQSAITELSAIAVSSTIHDGWMDPVLVKRKRPLRGQDTELYVIAKSSSPIAKGGHAYCLVGYNEVGFLVQNSWGPEWGKGGYATLPYEDWLDFRVRRLGRPARRPPDPAALGPDPDHPECRRRAVDRSRTRPAAPLVPRGQHRQRRPAFDDRQVHRARRRSSTRSSTTWAAGTTSSSSSRWRTRAMC